MCAPYTYTYIYGAKVNIPSVSMETHSSVLQTGVAYPSAGDLVIVDMDTQQFHFISRMNI